MEPTAYVAPPPPKPSGNVMMRALTTVVLERKLPYRVAKALDRLGKAVGLRYKTVSVRGFKIRVRRLTTDELFVQNLLVGEEYTPPGYEIREGDTVIDVGGNIGTFSLLAARRASRGRVFTFEPIRENYDLLNGNLARNRIRNVTAQKMAILDKKGSVKIYLSAENTGRHSVLEHRGSDADWFEEVETVSLADVFDAHNIERCHFLKMDCEGAEYPILYNLPRTYFRRIDKIVMEYHTEDRAEANRLVDFLQEVGYRIDAYVEFTGWDCGFIRAARDDLGEGSAPATTGHEAGSGR